MSAADEPVYGSDEGPENRGYERVEEQVQEQRGDGEVSSSQGGSGSHDQAEGHGEAGRHADAGPYTADSPVEDELDRWEEELADWAADLPGRRGGVAGRFQITVAPNAVINHGSVEGGQHLASYPVQQAMGSWHVESHEGPVSADEILAAQEGFATPDWFPKALAQLDTRVLFLTGEPGSGRRTAALNLLREHSRSLSLRAVDGDADLSQWRPVAEEADGYLMDGQLPQLALKPGFLSALRARLAEAEARLVIVLPHTPELHRQLERELHVEPVRCEPPSADKVFAARFESAVPVPAERQRLLDALEPGELDGLLTAGLSPAHVAELVRAITEPDAERAHETLRDRLSFLADHEVPDLLAQLLPDADSLAFLLSVCVFEGLDQRIIREEAERLLQLADGRFHALLPGAGGSAESTDGRPNPKFIFQKPLQTLLSQVRAFCGPREVRSGGSYYYTVEPIRFARHGQAEAVLRHVWRQYGQLSGLLTQWLRNVREEPELTRPAGQVLGMAARWGGGRRSLWHLRDLAKAEQRTSNRIAAYALGVAAEDPVLVSEVKHWLERWSVARSPHFRWTVAFTCGTEFGAARPEHALRLLRKMAAAHLHSEQEAKLDATILSSLRNLFASGNQQLVFDKLTECAEQNRPGASLLLRTLPELLRADSVWFQEQLLGDGEFAHRIVAVIQRSLDDDTYFPEISQQLLLWCRAAVWDEQQQAATERLLTALARQTSRGVLRLFVDMEQAESTELFGQHIARKGLASWRRAEPYRPPRISERPA